MLVRKVKPNFVVHAEAFTPVQRKEEPSKVTGLTVGVGELVGAAVGVTGLTVGVGELVGAAVGVLVGAR
jgi:hypothetical protein